jgi:hypothetical protein
MKELTLNRAQINKLSEIVNHFKEVKHFKIIMNHSSGIGPDVHVKFDLFEKADTTVDITDVSDW